MPPIGCNGQGVSMRQINDLGIHGLLRHTGLALLVATVLVSTALADQTPPPPIKPAAINTTADWDVGTCKARGGVVGRTHAGRAICLKAKMTPDKYKEQQGPQAAQPQPAQAAPNVGRTVGPRNPTYETPAPPPTQPETPPQTPAPE